MRQGRFEAPVPQYWIWDAMIFIENAVYAGRVASVENASDIQYRAPFVDQARYISKCVLRSINDISELNANALETNPVSVPLIRNVLAQLRSANGDLQAFVGATAKLDLGPTYEVSISSALAHLVSADQQMPQIAREYNLQPLLSRLQQMEASAPVP